MVKKEMVNRFGLTLVWLLAITVLHWGWRLNLVWFWLGGLGGTFLLDLEKFVYQKPFLLNPVRSPFRNIAFLLVLLVVCFYTITSSASFLGKGLVLATSLRLLKEVFQHPAKFFWPIKAELSFDQQQSIIVALSFLFLGLNLLLV